MRINLQQPSLGSMYCFSAKVIDLGVWNKADDCADSYDCVKHEWNIYNVLMERIPVICTYSVPEPFALLGLLNSGLESEICIAAGGRHKHTFTHFQIRALSQIDKMQM